MWSMFCKIFIGVRCLQTAKYDRYIQIKRVYGYETDEESNKRLQDETEQYKMETIDVEKGTNDANDTFQ